MGSSTGGRHARGAWSPTGTPHRVAEATIARRGLAIVASLRHGAQVGPREHQAEVATVRRVVIDHGCGIAAASATIRLALAQRMLCQIRCTQLLPTIVVEPRPTGRIVGLALLCPGLEACRTMHRRAFRHTGVPALRSPSPQAACAASQTVPDCAATSPPDRWRGQRTWR